MEFNFLAIALSVTINLIKRNSTKLGTVVVSLFHTNDRNLKSLSELNAEMKVLLKERDSYNQVDEFAKYSLVQRKVNKLTEKTKEVRNAQSKERMKASMCVKAVLIVLISLMSVMLIWYCYDKPVVDFQASIEKSYADANAFYPLNWLLSFPCAKTKNVIGFTFWLFITNRLIDIFANKLSSK